MPCECPLLHIWTCKLMMDSTLRNQQQSVLPRLPGKLRNKIYNHALAISRHDAIYVRKLGGGVATHYQSYKDGQFKEYDPVATMFGLTETCGQTHAETRLLGRVPAVDLQCRVLTCDGRSKVALAVDFIDCARTLSAGRSLKILRRRAK